MTGTGHFMRRMVQGASLGLVSFMLYACGTDGTPRPNATTVHQAPTRLPSISDRDKLKIPHLGDKSAVRVAILLPLTNSQNTVEAVGEALLNSAQLALFEIGNPNVVLIPKDTQGTPEGARQVAEEAIDEGADIILGPLFAGSVRTAGAVARARHVPMIAFSTDRTVGGDGVYLMSFLPEQEVKRVTDYAMTEGYYSFAGLVPQSAYGDRVRSAFQQVVSDKGGVITQLQSYPRNAEQMFAPARIVAEYDDRKANLKRRKASDEAYDPNKPLDAAAGSLVYDPETGELKAADPETLAQMRSPNRETWGGVSYQAILLAEGGTMLRSLAPLMPYFDVDPRKTKFLGTGLWDDPTLGKEPSLVGGWFAAPQPDMHDAYTARYESSFSATPPRISSLSFDAVALVASLARLPERDRFSAATLSNPNGFAGIDGIFRFLPDGGTERGLAVLQVQPDGLVVIDPAPKTFEKPRSDAMFGPLEGGDATTDYEGLGY
ncbi:MAG: penicillin-binding protein activator [Alphaproteobacteria bacterium]|nr:MAG: penicillin-binding protein activator [Alphaproteobacteria bacterium]